MIGILKGMDVRLERFVTSELQDYGCLVRFLPLRPETLEYIMELRRLAVHGRWNEITVSSIPSKSSMVVRP